MSIDDESQHGVRREDPDGEETAAINSQITMQQSSSSSSSSPSSTNSTPSSIANYAATVRVPNWILSESSLEVVFNERAAAQIQEYQINQVRSVELENQKYFRNHFRMTMFNEFMYRLLK